MLNYLFVVHCARDDLRNLYTLLSHKDKFQDFYYFGDLLNKCLLTMIQCNCMTHSIGLIQI